MPTLSFERRTHRLRISGTCPAAVLAAVREAVEQSADEAGGHLIVDLTAATDLERQLARKLVAVAREAAHSRQVRCVFLRRLGTPVDHALTAAEREIHDQG